MSRFPAKFGRVTVRHAAHKGSRIASSPVNHALHSTQETHNSEGRVGSKGETRISEYQEFRAFGQELRCTGPNYGRLYKGPVYYCSVCIINVSNSTFDCLDTCSIPETFRFLPSFRPVQISSGSYIQRFSLDH
jgi:hypothetical protein